MDYNVLIVDDSPILRRVIKRTVLMAGIDGEHVSEAGHGKEALEILAESQIDILLTDVHMPVMGGVELLQRMGADDRFAEIAKVVITSDASEERQNQLKELGIQSILTKPFQAEDIRDAVTSAIDEISHGKL